MEDEDVKEINKSSTGQTGLPKVASPHSGESGLSKGNRMDAYNVCSE